MRVAFQNSPVHKGAGVSLVGVADDVSGSAWSMAALLPFISGGEAGAAPAPQAGFLNVRDNLLGGHLECPGQTRIAVVSKIVVNIGRVNMAAVP